MASSSDENGGIRNWEAGWGGGYIEVSKRSSTSAVTTVAQFIRHSGVRPGSRVLDLGCGHGRVTELLVQRIPDLEVTGVDLTWELLDEFLVQPGTNGCRLHLVQANMDAGGLPFRDEEFDLAISSRVFHYLSHPIACLKEARRVVRPGGSVLISVPNRLNPVKALAYKRARLYSPTEVAAWFSAAGFLEVEAGSMCFFPSLKRGHKLAALCEHLDRLPLLGLLGGNVLVAGRIA